jgi:DUF1680 family protein
MVAWRLLLATADPWYADIIERTLYNVVAASPSTSGTRFFYANTLQQRQPGMSVDPHEASPRAAGGVRAPWFDVACCPTNLIRTFPALSMYFATADETGIQIHQYAQGTVAAVRRSLEVRLDLITDYPFSPEVRVRVVASSPEPWTLTMRIPGWCQGATFFVDGKTESAPPGHLRVRRTWRPNDEVVLSLPLVPRWVEPDFRIDAYRGSLALERGPIVYCVESVDQAESLDDMAVDSRQPVGEGGEPDGLTGAPALRVEGLKVQPAPDGWPYDELSSDLVEPTEAVTLTFIPYHAWGNRSPSSMRVWVPTHRLHEGSLGESLSNPVKTGP